jgi:predicted MPP superfamily phosphohydrolase
VTRPRRSRPRFLRFLLTVTLVAHLPVVAGVAELASRLRLPLPWLIGLAWGALGVLGFVWRARASMPDRKRSDLVVRFVDVPYFIHWCACGWTMIPAAVATVLGPLVDLVRGVPVGLPFGFYMWTYLSGLAVCAYGVLVRRRWFRVERIDVPVDGLDERLDGYTIAHLSDLHVGSFTPERWAARWTRAANELAADLAVVTGDLVTSGTAFHEEIARVVGGLSAKNGVFVSMGNHDYFGEGEPLVSLLRERGARVLRNEGVTLDKDGAALHLAAIDDTWTRRDDMQRALRDRPERTTTILLAHDPARFPDAAREEVDLVLSGHTHGGQIAVPFLSRRFSLAHITHRFVVGLYKLGRSVLYVHPGLGTTGPPIRVGVAPAVVLLTLRASPAS